MRNITEVIVVGQGVVGLSAAIAMRGLDYEVTVIDAGPAVNKKAPNISRIYAINPASINLFKKINVWQHINNAEISSYNRMHVWEAKTGAKIEFDSRINASRELGVMLEEATIKQALLKQAATLQIQLINEFKVTEVTEGANEIIIYNDSQDTWHGQLLIIADGARSSLRDKLGVKITTWPYNQNALIANVQTSKPHQKTAYQVFTPDGPLAFLPQANQYQSSIVWSLPPDKAQAYLTQDEKQFTANLAKTFAHKLGKIKLLSQRLQFPLHMRHTQQYSGKRWLLMGDAAHTIHPLAGLGLNIGLADLSTWLNEINQHNGAINSKKVLNSYQRKRKHALWQVIALMQGLHVLFTNKVTPITKLASFGLNLVNNLTPVKKLIIQHASGMDSEII